MTVNTNVPQLPKGINIGNKPKDIEYSKRARNNWVDVIETVMLIDATKTVQVDITGFSRSKTIYIKWAIKNQGKKMKLQHELRFGIKNDTLHIWVNK